MNSHILKLPATVHLALNIPFEYTTDYSKFVRDHFKEMDTVKDTTMHAAAGIAGEGGEVLDLIKKSWAYGSEIPVEKLIKELGDLRFYYQAMLNILDISDEQIKYYNVCKLQDRYPSGGYSDEEAIARVDVNQPVAETRDMLEIIEDDMDARIALSDQESIAYVSQGIGRAMRGDRKPPPYPKPTESLDDENPLNLGGK